MTNPLKNVCENANILALGGVHLVLLAHLQRSLHKSLEEDAKNVALREKSLLEEIKSLRSQLTAKEKERIEMVEAL